MEEQFKTLIVLSHYLEVQLLHWIWRFICYAVPKIIFFFLQTGRFSQFWDEASKNRHILEAVPGIFGYFVCCWFMDVVLHSCCWIFPIVFRSVSCPCFMLCTWYSYDLQENWLQVLSKRSKPMQFMFFPWLTKRFPDLCLLRYMLLFFLYLSLPYFKLRGL